MSVGEWLDTVILESAADAGVTRPSVAAAQAHDADQRPSSEVPLSGERLADLTERLGDLARQLDHLGRAGEAAPARGQERGARDFAQAIAQLNDRIDRLAAAARSRARTDPPPMPLAAAPTRSDSPTALDQAMMEIADRQRALDGYGAAAPASPGALPRARTQGLSALEQQLREINAQIADLNRPCSVGSAVERMVETLRDDLAEIGVMLQEAMPRQAIEALEREIRKLNERIDQTRQAGADGSALAGVERGLAEVRDALRALTPAENLAWLDRAVKELTQRIDTLALGHQDPAALKQLEGAIVALRGIVSHVASNDALAKLADEVRALAAKVDQAASGSDLINSLEQRIAAMADALAARNPRNEVATPEFEATIRRLSDKLERMEPGRPDDALVAQLEGRIAQLVAKLEASDARLSQLEAVERGLAQLLIHIEQKRVPLLQDGEEKAPPARVDALQRDLATLQQTERKTQDSLEAVQGALDNVVERLATIEGDLRGRVDNAVMAAAKAVLASAAPAMPIKPLEADATAREAPAADDPPAARSNADDAPIAGDEPSDDDAPPTQRMTLPAAPTLQPSEPAQIDAPHQPKPTPPTALERRPIDPTLPPDHPLEPGSGARGRYLGSPAERIAASEAALATARPPVIADPGGKSNFIAAARRAAQAAAGVEGLSRQAAPTAAQASSPSMTTQVVGAMRKHARMVIVGISVAVIVLGSLNIVRNWLAGAEEPELPSAPKAMTSTPEPEPRAPALPVAPPAPATTTEAPAAPVEPLPGRQSSLFPPPAVPPFAASVAETPARPAIAAPAEVTGTIARPLPQPAPSPAQAAAAPSAPQAPADNGVDQLPQGIAGALRAAAAKGEAAAQYEIAMRFLEGRGVPQNLAEALAWFERAAKQGLAPAQFRLGGLYEKGFGVKKNTEMARRYYTAAGEAGHAKALHNLAVLYAEGIDGKPDYRTAAHWFRRAAVYGVSDSQYNLGILYARGIGVEQNLTEAYRWFTLAARSGDQESVKKRDEVATRLDPQSLQTAKQAVEAFVPEPQPEAATQVKAPPGGWDGEANAVSSPPAPAKRKPPAAAPKSAPQSLRPTP
jgi:localization factor PodJL